MIEIKSSTGILLKKMDSETLRGADLRGADLSRAALSGADLSGADLRGADLRGANLSDADLRGAALSGAYLSRADLSDAYLSGADLRRADLSDAYLSGADLRGADLRGANLSRAALSGAVLPECPSVEDLCEKILQTVPDGGLNMESWHTCGTTHCLAGWAVHLAGEEGVKLEKELGANAAGALIWHASIGKIPNFYSSNKEAIEFLNQNNK